MGRLLQILYLEDNPRDAELVQDRLRQDPRLACNVQVVSDRAAYEAALDQGSPDLVLSDYSLPGYDGMAAMALARAKQPGVPFVVFTGTLGDEQAVECMLAGATDCVLKHRLGRLVPAVLRALGEADERRKRRETEEALRESEAEFRAMFETASIGMAQADPRTGQWLRVNQKMCEITGYSADELLQRRTAELTHPADQERDGELFQQVVRGEAPNYCLEKRYLRKDGAVSWVNVNMTIIRDAAGQPKRTMATIEDITERKRAEIYREMGREVLQILNEPGDLPDTVERVLATLKTRTGFDAVGIRLQDGEDFPYFAQNGFSKEFLLTANALIAHDADGGVCRDKDGNACLECTCGLVISGKTDPANPLFARGGSFWTNDSFSLLELPADQDPRLHPRNQCIHQGYASVALVPIRTKDRVVGLIHLNARRKDGFTLETVELLESIGAHIAAALIRKQGERELRESMALTEAVVDNVPLMVFLKEAEDLRFVMFNRAGEDLLGYDRKALLGKNNLDLFPPEQAAHFMAKDQEALAGHGVVDIPEEEILTARKGKRILHTQKVSILGYDGRTRYLLGISEDITEHKRKEADHARLQAQLTQAQKLESVGLLAGGVAHDFNNLLMGIMSYVELCRDKIGPDHPIREWLDEITRDAQRSAEITRQLLAFARRQMIAPKILDLNEAVAGMLKLLQRLIGEDIKLTWRPGTNLRPVKLDPSQVDQILANLCVNARDAIAGVGKINLETASITLDADYCASHADAIPGAYTVLAVSDDGCGMDKETMAQVFEPFFTTKGLGQGTGLGLATVYGIVKQNRGSIHVYSEVGHGTTFRIFLPQAESDAVAAPGTGIAEAPKGRGETILLAEDEKSLRVTCGLFLEGLGYKVLRAETPGEALKLADRHPGDIHLLLTDVVMPGMDGRQLAHRISAAKPGVKVLFMSGYTADVIAQRGVLEQSVDFIGKPFTRDVLAWRVREILDEHSALQPSDHRYALRSGGWSMPP
jgi:PAS domain S-box-containing protein